MLIMPFIFDSGYLFSASKALDISSSDAGVLSIFPRALSNNYVIYRQPSSSILWMKHSNWLLFYYKYLVSTLCLIILLLGEGLKFHLAGLGRK